MRWFVLLRVNCRRMKYFTQVIFSSLEDFPHPGSSSCCAQVDNGSSSSLLSLLLPLSIHSLFFLFTAPHSCCDAREARWNEVESWSDKRSFRFRSFSVVSSRTFHFLWDFLAFNDQAVRQNNENLKFVQLSVSLLCFFRIWYVSNLTKLFLLCSRDIFEQFDSRFFGVEWGSLLENLRTTWNCSCEKDFISSSRMTFRERRVNGMEKFQFSTDTPSHLRISAKENPRSFNEQSFTTISHLSHQIAQNFPSATREPSMNSWNSKLLKGFSIFSPPHLENC